MPRLSLCLHHWPCLLFQRNLVIFIPSPLSPTLLRLLLLTFPFYSHTWPIAVPLLQCSSPLHASPLWICIMPREGEWNTTSSRPNQKKTGTNNQQPPSSMRPSAISSTANPDSDLPNDPPMLIMVSILRSTIPFNCDQSQSSTLERSFS